MGSASSHSAQTSTNGGSCGKIWGLVAGTRELIVAPGMATAVIGDKGPYLVKMLRCFCLRVMHATGKNVTGIIDEKLKSWYVVC
jgi:hypothetical protein